MKAQSMPRVLWVAIAAFLAGGLGGWFLLSDHPQNHEDGLGAAASVRPKGDNGPLKDRVGMVAIPGDTDRGVQSRSATSSRRAVETHRAWPAFGERLNWIRERGKSMTEEDIAELQALYAKLVTEPGTRELRMEIMGLYGKLDDLPRADALIRQAMTLENADFDGDVVIASGERFLSEIWKKNMQLGDVARSELLDPTTDPRMRRSLLQGVYRCGGPGLAKDLQALYFSTPSGDLRFNAINLLGYTGSKDEVYAVSNDAMSLPSIGGVAPSELIAATLCLQNLANKNPQEKGNAVALIVQGLMRNDLTDNHVFRMTSVLRTMDPAAFDKLPQSIHDRLASMRKPIDPGYPKK